MIRKLVSVVEELSAEPGAGPNEPVRRAAAAAVIANPWAGLRPRRRPRRPRSSGSRRSWPSPSPTASPRCSAAPRPIEAFGKAAIVGTDGEIEHGAALIHTPWFGDVVRQALDGTSIIVFSDTRGPAGTALVVPVWHKTAAATRSHYQTVEIRIADAPRPGEIVLVCAAATGGRPQARIGDRTTDTATVRLEDHRP